MTQENHGKHYWKDVGLVVLGAVMASIPTLTVAYLHEKNEVHRLVVDRQITAIKDFAACTNKAATQVLPEIEENDEKIASLYEQYKQHLITENEIASVLKKTVNTQRSTMLAWQAEYNTQRAVINLLFHVKLTAMNYSDPIDKQSPEIKTKSLEASLKELKDSKGSYRKAVLEVLDTSNRTIDYLGTMVEY